MKKGGTVKKGGAVKNGDAAAIIHRIEIINPADFRTTRFFTTFTYLSLISRSYFGSPIVSSRGIPKAPPLQNLNHVIFISE